MATIYEIEEEDYIKEVVEKEIPKIRTVEISGTRPVIIPAIVDWNYHTSISFNNQDIEIPF